MILSIDSNDANTAPLHKKTISSLSGAVESMMKKLEDVGVLVARILMPILFITAGWGKITGYAGTQQYMEAMGVPGFMLPLVILLEFGGGLAILFGFLTRTTALFTAGFTLLTAFLCSTATGVLFGWLPARNAARLDPVDALARE